MAFNICGKRIKKINKYFLIPLFFLTGCSLNPLNFGSNIEIEKRELKDFKNVIWEGIGTLNIEEDSNFSIIIAAKKESINKIKTQVRGDTLYIFEESSILDVNKYSNRDYSVYAKDIEKVQLKGIGNIRINKSKSKRLDLQLNGKGNILAKGLENKKLNIEIAGYGDIELQGETESQKIKISGSGNVISRQLKTDQASIDISGIGEVEVNSKKSLNVSISGKGEVTYYNNPQIEQSITGLGEIKKR